MPLLPPPKPHMNEETVVDTSLSNPKTKLKMKDLAHDGQIAYAA
jgi:hypothetical protein